MESNEMEYIKVNKKELEALYDRLKTLEAVETLEYYNKNYLSGDNAIRCKTMMCELGYIARDIGQMAHCI